MSYPQVLESTHTLPASMPRPQERARSRLDLRFAAVGSATRMFVPAQQPPWRAIRAFPNRQGQAVVHLHNVSGGILAGDALDLSVEAGPGSRVQVTSVGATRIYRHRAGRETAHLATSIHVGRDALLEYLPDMIIPFSGSRCSQSTQVSLGPNAGFIGWESIAAGRVASGEEFAFDWFHSEVSVRSETRPLALERYSLEPRARDPRSPARWGRFRYLATLYVCNTGIEPSRWIGIESRLNDDAFRSSTSEWRWGVSALVASGLVIRGLALEAHQIMAGLLRFWGLAKQEIWGEPAVPPRKIN